MRVAIINASVKGERAFPGADIADLLSVSLHKGRLVAPLARDLYDYDLFVVDMANVPTKEALDQSAKPISNQINERVGAGGGIICFAAHGRPLSWLPVSFALRQGRGERVKIEDVRPYKALFEKYEHEINWQTQFEQPEGAPWTPLLRSLGGWPVAGVSQKGGLVLVLPGIRRKEAFLKDLFDQVIPEVAPELLISRPTMLTEPPPDWVDQFPIPEAHSLRGEIAALDEKIRNLREERDAKERDAAELEAYQGLLWLQGEKHLEPIVEKALKLLGIDAHPRRPVDLAYEDEDGPLYMEVEGTNGSIELHKGRQLLGYIADAEDPSGVRGAIIGNPFRLEHPLSRPPPNRVLFVRELESMAKKQSWLLLTTVELFEYVRRHLAGDAAAARELRKRLGLGVRAKAGDEAEEAT